MMQRGTFRRPGSSSRHRADLLGLACLAGAVWVGALGCVDERAFSIVQNQVPESGCVIPGESGTKYRGSGSLDLRGRQGYWLFPLLRNDLPATVSIDQQPERNRIYLKRFEIELDLEGAVNQEIPAELTSFSVPTSAEMAPGQLRSSSVKIIPDLLVPLLVVPGNFDPTVTATVRAIADHNGSELESTPINFPVKLCNGCWITMLDACPAADDENVTIQPNVCGLPQDGPVTCCNDSSRGFICLPGEESGG